MRTAIATMRLMTLVAIAWIAGDTNLSRADEGGTKDSAGLVWTGSMNQSPDNPFGQYSWFTWDGANYAAGVYAVWDVDANGNPRLYDDWRVPTIREIQRACDDGTLSLVMPRPQPDDSSWGVWSSTRQGIWATLVDMEMDPVTTFIIPGSAVPLRIHRDSGMDAVFVRGRPPLK